MESVHQKTLMERLDSLYLYQPERGRFYRIYKDVLIALELIVLAALFVYTFVRVLPIVWSTETWERTLHPSLLRYLVSLLPLMIFGPPLGMWATCKMRFTRPHGVSAISPALIMTQVVQVTFVVIPLAVYPFLPPESDEEAARFMRIINLFYIVVFVLMVGQLVYLVVRYGQVKQQKGYERVPVDDSEVGSDNKIG